MAGTYRRALDGTQMYTCPNVECAMGKKEKAKKKSQSDASNDLFKRVEEIYVLCSKETAKDSWPEFEVLHGLLSKLESLQEPQLRKRNGEDRFDKVGTFVQWLDDNHVDHSFVKLAKISEGVGLGLHAAHMIQQGEKFITVPVKVMMLASQAMEGNLGLLASRDPLLQVMPHLSLAMLLLNEYFNPQSYWKPYIDVLPTEYSTPLYFSKEDFQLLHGSPTQKECIKQVWNIAKLYSHLYLLMSECPTLTACLPVFQSGFCYRDFCWAVSSVTTRQNKIPLKGHDGSHDLALIPLWDMCNHTEGDITTDYDPVTRQCVCYAAHPVSAGEEICIYYGPRPNSELLLYSGFVYADNRHDYLKIKLGLSSSEGRETRETRAEILQQLGLPIVGEYKLHLGDSPIDPDLLAFARIFTANKELLTTLSALSKEEKNQKLRSSDVQGEYDSKAMDFLHKRCELLLMAYKRSVEDDKLLESTTTLTTRHVVTMCMCEKKLLRVSSRYCKDKI